MSSFNKELINKVKLFQSESDSFDLIEEKYSFLKYIFKNLESLDDSNIDICEEEFDALRCNIDGCFFDEDSNAYNLYIVKYNTENDDDSTLSENDVLLEYAKINNFIERIIKNNYNAFGEESVSFEIADRISKGIKENDIVVNFISNYLIATSLKKDGIEDIAGQRVSFRTYDLDDLKSKFSQISKESFITDFIELFQSSITALKISETPDFEVYMCSIRGDWLAKLYKEDSIRLLESNVRSYLKRTAKVNAGILETVKNTPEEFVSYNNGISAVATNISMANDSSPHSKFVSISSIDNFQIVNGGQTTATLYECLKDKLVDELHKIIVPVKLTVVRNIGNAENLIRNISIYSNTQTAIKKSDPPSNLPFYVTIKQLSQSVVSTVDQHSYMCYFERTNGEYDTEYRRNNGSKKFILTNPKDKRFTKIDLAIAINAWEQHPDIVCLGREKCFTFFNANVKKMLKMPDEEFFKAAYANIIIYRKFDKIAKRLGLSYKSTVIAYTLSLISYIFSKKADIFNVWEQKDLTSDIMTVAYELMPKVHNVIANPPKPYSEPRMWARKEQCWEEVKKITTEKQITLLNAPYEFFANNEVISFIEDDNNFYNSMLWMKLLLWNSKYKMLNRNQEKMIKYMRTINNTGLTKKQIEYVKEIFYFAVKSGFQYK